MPQNPNMPWKPPGEWYVVLEGVPNKTTALLKDAILQAAEAAGGKAGLMGYLRAQAKKKNSGPFLALLGKVLPTQISGDPDNPVASDHHVIITLVEAKDSA